MRIACLHTAASNVAVFDAAAAGLEVRGLELTHEVRADLLLDAESAGGVTPEITERTRTAMRALTPGSDVVLLTCSTVGEAVPVGRNGEAVPFVRVDRSLAERAVRLGGRVVVLCAVATTVAPTTAVFDDAARITGAVVEVRLVPGAWRLFRAGNIDGYLASIAAAADAAFAEGASVVALAQASMAGAALLGTKGQPLASPATGLRAAIAAVCRSGRGM